MIKLKSDRLFVEICEPGEERNRTVRFDRAGFIRRVTLDNMKESGHSFTHEFCTLEPDNLSHPCSGGAGLCSEIKDNNIWNGVPSGGQCPKFGVGLLEKPNNQPYHFYDKSYRADYFDVSWEKNENSAVFRTEPKPCRGYALRGTKTVLLQENRLTVRYKFDNLGEKTLNLCEYVHNFVTIDRLPLGPDYTLSFPTARSQDGKRGETPGNTIIGKGKGFTFSSYNPKAAEVELERAEFDPDKPFRWILANTGSPASVSEEDSFVPDCVPIWCIDHIISPEVYHRFCLAPGESHSYSRRWVFSD